MCWLFPGKPELLRLQQVGSVGLGWGPVLLWPCSGPGDRLFCFLGSSVNWCLLRQVQLRCACWGRVPERAPTWRRGGCSSERARALGDSEAHGPSEMAEELLFPGLTYPLPTSASPQGFRGRYTSRGKAPSVGGCSVSSRQTAEVSRRALRWEMLLGSGETQRGLCKEWTQLPPEVLSAVEDWLLRGPGVGGV